MNCAVNNLSFDNDTFLLATEEFKDASGNIIAADEVPVTIRGDEYDFDGRGMVMHWDERIDTSNRWKSRTARAC